MNGNELEVVKYLVANIGKISLPHLGKISKIGAPYKTLLEQRKFTNISKKAEISLIKTEDSGKKADIYINQKGCSIKQSGSCFLYNRLQRSEILEVFTKLQFSQPTKHLECLDSAIDSYHVGEIQKRSLPWNTVFTVHEFKKLLKFLMMTGSPNLGVSSHPADFILEAPQLNIRANNILVYTFEEYFEKYSSSFYIAMRRQWYGQRSKHEHNRVRSLMNKPDNLRWVYSDVAGSPRGENAWRPEIAIEDRKTAYLLFVEKI